MLFPSHLSAQDDCGTYDEVQSLHYISELYLKLENALINDHKSMLEELRVGFSSFDIKYITFEVEIHVVNGTNVTCDDHDQDWWFVFHPSFCPARNNTSEYKWQLCHRSEIIFNVPSASEFKSENAVFEINQFLVWASAVHGSVLYHIIVVTADYRYKYYNPQFEGTYDSIKLNIDRLDCNPYSDRLKCDVSELFSWVSSSYTRSYIYLHMESMSSMLSVY